MRGGRHGPPRRFQAAVYAEPRVLNERVVFPQPGPDPVPNDRVTAGARRERALERPAEHHAVEGPAAKTPPGARTIDLKGRYLLPGLIDAHVHAGNIELKTPVTAGLPPAVYVLKACRNLETDLQLGFTTVRDAAGLDPSDPRSVEGQLVGGLAEREAALWDLAEDVYRAMDPDANEGDAQDAIAAIRLNPA